MSTEITIKTIDGAICEVANAQENALSLRNGFATHFEKLHNLAEQAKTVGEGQPKKAKELRLAIRAVRCAADKTREELKADSLRYGKAVQGVYNVLEYQAVPMEAALEKIEKAEELREQARKKALFETRGQELRPYIDPTHMQLGEMAEEAYQNLLAASKKAHEEKLAEAERQRVAEIERQKSEAAERARLEQARVEEAAKLKADNERLAAEASKLRAEQEAKDRAADELRKKEREAAEAERKKMEEDQAVERKKLQEEQRKRQAAEEEARRIKREQEEKEKAERAAIDKAERAPDKDKILAFANMVRAAKINGMRTQAGNSLASAVSIQADRFAAWIESEAARL